MARRVMRHSSDTERKGDFKEVLSLAEDVIRLGVKLREQSFWFIDPMVSISIQFIAFAGETRKLSTAEVREFAYFPDGGAKRMRVLGQRFAEFARKHGRNDLAEWAMKEAEESTRVRALIKSHPFDDFFFGEIKQRESPRLVTNCLTGFALLLSALELAIVALISAAFLCRTTVTIDSYSPVTAALVVAGLPLDAIIWGSFGALKEGFWEVMGDKNYFGAICLPFANMLIR